MVHRRSKVERQAFRKLPNGATYHKSSDGTGPFVKVARAGILAANSPPTTAGWTPTAVTDVSIETKKVTKFAMKSQRSV